MSEPAIVYTTPTCPYCKHVKDYLRREGIEYVEKNVASDRQAAMEMVRRSQQTGVPVTFIAGETIVGFDQPRLKTVITRLRQSASSAQPAVTPPKIGAKVIDAIRQGGNLPGVFLAEVHPGALAAKAGLKDGDIVIALHDKTVTSTDDLAQALRQIATAKIARPGVVFVRQGQRMDTRLPLDF